MNREFSSKSATYGVTREITSSSDMPFRSVNHFRRSIRRVGHADVARRLGREDLVDDRELLVVVRDFLEHAQRERQLLGALHVADERGQAIGPFSTSTSTTQFFSCSSSTPFIDGDPEALAQAEQRVVAAVLAQLLQRAPAIGLLGELVGRFLDRALESAILGEQAENHFFYFLPGC